MVQAARRDALKLSAAALPFWILGPVGSGRTTLAEEAAALRSRDGNQTSLRIRAERDLRLLADSADPNGERVTAVITGVEAMAAPARNRRLHPILIGLPRAMSGAGDLGALITASVELPPPKDRGEELMHWVQRMLERACEGGRKRRLSAAAVNAIRIHEWPGNLRELDSRLRKAVLLTEHDAVSAEALDLAHLDDTVPFKPMTEAVEEFKAAYIAKALEKTGCNRTRAAKLLGVDVRTIFRMLESPEKG